MRAIFLALCLVACTPALSAEFPSTSLRQLNQLEKKPEVYLKSPTGNFLVTNNTKIEISMTDGRLILVLAAEVFVKGEQLILRGREQFILLSQIKSVRYIDRY
jgi:hypothetical protein